MVFSSNSKKFPVKIIFWFRLWFHFRSDRSLLYHPVIQPHRSTRRFHKIPTILTFFRNAHAISPPGKIWTRTILLSGRSLVYNCWLCTWYVKMYLGDRDTIMWHDGTTTWHDHVTKYQPAKGHVTKYLLQNSYEKMNYSVRAASSS